MDLSDLQAIAQREREHHRPVRIRCCTAAGCQSSGSTALAKQLTAAVETGGWKPRWRCAVSAVCASVAGGRWWRWTSRWGNPPL
jgi:hypothetical protein